MTTSAESTYAAIATRSQASTQDGVEPSQLEPILLGVEALRTLCTTYLPKIREVMFISWV
jgi:hypothetical protein